METCIICKNKLGSNYATIGDKGRSKLVESSQAREDGLSTWFQTKDPLKVHTACRKSYTRDSSIKAAANKKDEVPEEQEPNLRSKIPVFDVKTHCLFCAELLQIDNRIPSERRKVFSNVETIEFKETVLKRASEREDNWGQSVAQRICLTSDLVAAEAKYHRNCAQDFFTKTEKVKCVGKPANTVQECGFIELCSYLDENEECQYSLPELLDYMETFLNGEEGYSMKYFKQKLKEHYGDDIIITCIPGKPSIVSFRDSAHKALRQKWITDRETEHINENERIVDMAASILLNDIRLKVYDLGTYSSMENTENGDAMIPALLKRFLSAMIDPKGKNSVVAIRRITAIAHSIISACRPKSFVSPLLLAIAVYIHRKYASRELIDILSSISFSDDYKEVQRFESGLVSSGEPSYFLSCFTQFVFDNADFNVATLTGHNTFHTMGGIACVTPPGNVNKTPIKRNIKLPPAGEIGNFGNIPIKTYNKPAVPGLQSVIVEPLKISDKCLQATNDDCIWLAGYVYKLNPHVSWSGFMKVAVEKNEYETSRIETLPFIKLDPSNLSTIYTALCFASEQARKIGLKTSIVTFDQPLYQKAAEIVAASEDLPNVIVRLGGFHLLMSYLGSIGQIMSGSGLSELWETVYAKGTVIHMMTGHAFSRSIRAHILSLVALVSVLMEQTDQKENVNKSHLQKLYDSLFDETQSPHDVIEDDEVTHLHQIMSEVLEEAANKSRTGKLWVQYVHQVFLVLNFIRAERTGNWKLHINCVREIIPHFHAAGHLPYAKSARLYLQLMESLQHVMSTDEYELFTEKGYFTIRRTDDFWAGNFSDQTIEQFLMRNLKSSGGITHGRGITDSTLTKWVHALPQCVPTCDALEEFTGVHTGTSEQHKDLRPSTLTRDDKDLDKFCQWLLVHPPFAGYQQDRLVSLSTGVVADATVNCDDAINVGHAAAAKITGKGFTDIKLHRSDKVKTMSDKDNTIAVRGKDTVVNPNLFFNRINCVLSRSSDLQEFFTYELAPQPPSLFSDGMMRKPTKSALGSLLKSFVTQQSHTPDKSIFVVDGGHLLQTVIWSQPAKYSDICQSYVSYTLRHFGIGTTVVFDGYGTNSTKVAEQRRRAMKQTSSDIIFDENMQTTTTQAAFLANSSNKKRLISMLSEKMREAGIYVKQAEADADAMIVATVLSLAESQELPVTLVGTDTDLLVMLVAQTNPSASVYMLCRSSPTTIYNINEIQESIGTTSQHLMFIHAITGCDTVSAIYRQGKRKAFNVVHKNQDDELVNIMQTFEKAGSTNHEVQNAGESFILRLYGASNYKSLNDYRHIAYRRAISRSSLNSSFLLASLPQLVQLQNSMRITAT